MNFEEKKKDVRINIGNNIKKYREIKGLTKAEFASALSKISNKKIARSSVTAWESGTYSPDLALIYYIAQILGIDINSIISNDTQSNHNQSFNQIVLIDDEGVRYTFSLNKEQIENLKQLLSDLSINSTKEVKDE